MNLTFSQLNVWNNEGIVEATEGSTLILTCTYWGVVSACTAACYKGGQAVTSTVFPSGSISGTTTKIITLKPAVLAASGTYVVAITSTISSEVYVNKIQIRVQKAKAVR